MQGTRSRHVAVIATLLTLGVGAAAADGVYDRKLERAVMAIVAKKMGSLRGSLEREWQPSGTSDGDIWAVAPLNPSAFRSGPQLDRWKAGKASSRPLASRTAASRRTEIASDLPLLDGSPVASIRLSGG